MTLEGKNKLNSYLGKKIAALFPTHAIKVDVKVNSLKQEVTINIRSATLSLLAIRRSKRLREYIKRIAPICANYFNLEVETIRFKNSKQSPYPFYYDVATSQFISWFKLIKTWQ